MVRNRLNALFHTARVRLCGPKAYPLHDHAFGEIFWVDEGRGEHVLNGKKVPLEEGDCVFLRPRDCHSLHSRARQPFYLIIICFQWHIYEGLLRRYFPEAPGPYGEQGAKPKFFRLSKSQLEWARALSFGLLRAPATHFHIERALMNVFAEFCPLPEKELFPDRTAPDWLRNAWNAMQDPVRLRRGLPEFHRLCGRCPEHVAREFRRWTGRTPVAAVTGLRMEHAAALLEGTRHEIVDLAMHCGFDSLSHFYHCFRQAYNMSPAVFRRRAQDNMLPAFERKRRTGKGA